MLPNELSEDRKELFRFTAAVEDIEMYFSLLRNNQDFYIPVYRRGDGRVSLYFSKIPDFHFGQCRFFMEKAHCDQWCHDIYLQNESAKVLTLVVPSSKLLGMIEHSKKEQKKLMAPCDMSCFTHSKEGYFLVDCLYSDKQRGN